MIYVAYTWWWDRSLIAEVEEFSSIEELEEFKRSKDENRLHSIIGVIEGTRLRQHEGAL